MTSTGTKRQACEGKVRHASKREAVAHVRRKIRLGALASTLRVYRCDHCGGYHVGHYRPGKRPTTRR
jgi:hypothetical protein